MFIATAVISVVLAALLVFSAGQKLGRSPQVVSTYTRVGVPEERLPLLAAILLAGAAGLAIGLVVRPLGIAAASGLIAYFAIAVGAHIRHRQLGNIATPVLILGLSALALVLRLLTT